jgi:large subunit ribosomal protein L32e
MSMKKIVEIRNKLKAKKPTFTRQDAHKKKRLGTGWRKPKGRQSKMRLHRKSYARSRSSGYGSPRGAYGLSREGLTQNIVATLTDFSGLDAKNDGIIIARTTGNRRKAQLVEYATKNSFTLLNIDIQSFNKNLELALGEKAAKKKSLLKKREEKDAAAKKASDKEKKKAAKATSKDAKEEVSAQEKKAQEKKEHDKVLTKEN